jgi:uncharacterized protein
LIGSVRYWFPEGGRFVTIQETSRGAVTVEEIHQATFGRQWQQWRLARERDLAAPHGFLAVTGIFWLTATPERYPGAPGEWSTDGDGVKVVLDEGETLTEDDVVIRGEHRFEPLPERGGRTVLSGDAAIEIAKRGGNYVLRPRHPDHDLRANFSSVPTYSPDPRWAFDARFVAFNVPRPTTVGSVVEGLEHVYDAPGQVEFDFDGARFRLTAFNGRRPGSLMVLFTDATSGTTTYAANRALELDAPDEHGNVSLDFNRAVNLPCAFTDFATCPLPPTENKLPIAVEAGETIPYERQSGGRTSGDLAGPVRDLTDHIRGIATESIVRMDSVE